MATKKNIIVIFGALMLCVSSAWHGLTAQPNAPKKPPAAIYTFETIDHPDATTCTSASKINNRKQIVGGYCDVSPSSHGFLLENGVFTTIDVPGATRGQALGINNRGQIVGNYVDVLGEPLGLDHGFLLDNGVFTTIDVPGAVATAVFDINNHGQMVGNYGTAINGPLQGFLLDRGVFTSIDFPNAQATEALGINNSGQIVGFYLDSNLMGHGFLWENGAFTTIDAPGAAANTATFDINDKGQIVGFHDGGTTGRSSFLFDNGEFISLDVPGALDTSALGINNRGEIVGEYTTAGFALHGFLATPQGRGPLLIVRREVIRAGRSIVARWRAIPAPTSTDWIGLYLPGSPNTAFIDWIYVSCSKTPGNPDRRGSCDFPIPASLAPGTYELRLLANDGFMRLASSDGFIVRPSREGLASQAP